jgi:hypothetical protein
MKRISFVVLLAAALLVAVVPARAAGAGVGVEDGLPFLLGEPLLLPIVDGQTTGGLTVQVSGGTIVATNAGTFAVQCTSGCAGSGGTAAVDESAFTLTSGAGTLAMGYYQTTPDTLATGKVGVFGMTQGRALFVNFRNEDGTVAALATDATVASTASTTGPQVMGKVVDDVSALTLGSTGNTIQVSVDGMGRLITVNGCDRTATISGVQTSSSGAEVSILGAPGASKYNAVYGGVISNLSGTDTEVALLDGSGGSAKAKIPAPKGTAAGGATFAFPTPIYFTANTAVYADPSGSPSSVAITLFGCKVK